MFGLKVGFVCTAGAVVTGKKIDAARGVRIGVRIQKTQIAAISLSDLFVVVLYIIIVLLLDS
jgi:hypothetical protein